MQALNKKPKNKKEKQRDLGLKMGLNTQVSGLKYRLQKMERVLEVSPFWRSSFVWFVISFNIFIYIIAFFYLYDKIGDLPSRIPFFFIYSQGERQLAESDTLWYFYGATMILSIINIFFAGKLYASDRNEAKFLLCAEVLKTLLFSGLIYKTFINWL